MDLSPLSADDVRGLISAAVSATASPDVDQATRRRLLVEELMRLVNADSGHWAWGHGHPLDSAILPVSIIDIGYSDRQRVVMAEHALHPDSIAMFQARVASRMAGQPRAAVARRDVIPDEEWLASGHWQGYVERLGLDSWVHAVSYHAEGFWSCLHLLRAVGKPEFGAREVVMADLALGSISWLGPMWRGETANNSAPPELTPRQRTVLLLLLDGSSRKAIACLLGISENTVDSHLRAIFERFGVRSVAELASRFLKMA